MKRLAFIILILFLLLSCSKSVFKDSGSFTIVNYSDKIIEFVWITTEGDLYPISKSINVRYGETFEIKGLDPGKYDIAIDYKGEFNSFNSKKDKDLCLEIDKGINKVWVLDPDGNIKRQ